MRFVIAPAASPPAEGFVLLETGAADVPDAAPMLERFSRLGRFRGHRRTPPDAGGGLRQVVASADWATLAFGDDAPRYAETDCLLVPEDYPWGYATFARSLSGWGHAPARSGVVTREEARAHWTRYGKCELEGERLIPTDKDALAFLQKTASLHGHAVEAVMRRWSDEESRRTYRRLLHGTQDDLFLHFREEVFRTVQYCDCVRWSPGMVIVNGGVQEGFELPYFMAHCGGEATVLSVDPSGFDGLSASARAIVDRFPERNMECRHALWSESGHQALPVTDEGVVLSQYKGRNVHALRELTFECRSVDDLVSELHLDRVDLVKLDVEGAEPFVLRGMSRTLARHRPQLAISIYHWPEHMWQIPNELMDALVGYDFYLRHYSYGRWECILYAVPRELA